MGGVHKQKGINLIVRKGDRIFNTNGTTRSWVPIIPDSPYETRLQGIMVAVFSVVKSSICFVEYNSYDSLQARVIEGIGH